MTRNVAYLLRGAARSRIRAAMVAVVGETPVQLRRFSVFTVFSCLLVLALFSFFTLPFAASLGFAPGRAVGLCEANIAFADDTDTIEDKQLTAYELQLEIEARQESLAAAYEEVDEAAGAIDEKQWLIDELDRQIPEQRKRSAQAARELYKFQNQSAGIIDMLLNSGSFEDFLKQIEYVDCITSANLNELNRLNKLEEEIASAQGELKEAQANAEARAEDARLAMLAAQEAQAEVQRRIEEEARAQAEIAIMAEKMAEQERTNDVVDEHADETDGGDNPSEANAEGASGENGSSEGGESGESGEQAASSEGVQSPSAVDLPADEAAFVAEWAPRIDAYLAGSPLAGQGTTFARAAYTYGVDPRFSPAISFTESGKGAACFLPHNAWGWGSASWDTWEEAINDHVAGLAAGYGGQISIEGAQKYCPPNWQAWYDRTLGQMELI